MFATYSIRVSVGRSVEQAKEGEIPAGREYGVWFNLLLFRFPLKPSLAAFYVIWGPKLPGNQQLKTSLASCTSVLVPLVHVVLVAMVATPCLSSLIALLALGASSKGMKSYPDVPARLLTFVASVLSRDPSIGFDAGIGLATLQSRAVPNAPNGYTPVGDNCPSDRPTVRSATSLSPNETSWLELRRNNTITPMRDLLARFNITGFDAASYITNNAKNASALPNVAIAISGGGYRALMTGGGAVQAFDSREGNSTNAGHLGGLLQVSTYLAGLSGGSWLVGSIYVNNFTTISTLQGNATSTWEFQNSIFTGPSQSGLQLLNTADYFANVENAVSKKNSAGFPTSVTDYWGRALSFQLVNASDGGPGYTWSSIALDQTFAQGNAPMPIVVTDGRAPGEQAIPSNTTVYEFNPWEFGTFDPTTYGFAPLEYLGSNFSNGVIPSNEKCVRGFDNVGYVMGTSSSLFNQFLLQVNSTSLPSLAKDFITKVLGAVSTANNDIADYPNPFYGYHNASATSREAQSQTLSLVDGGEDLENIPLHPLIQPGRHVDVIFAVDSSADTDSYWPNGTALVATYQRSLNSSGQANGTSFPAIPDQNTFVNLGLNTRPTFFGCNSSNTTHMTPLIVYLPNFPYTFQSNVSTFDPSYNTSQRDSIILNGYHAATMGNGTRDAQWPTCVGCAILSRSLERTRTMVPDVCKQCFTRYCWNGTLNSANPPPYQPNYALNVTTVKSAASGTRSPGHLVAAIAMLMVVMLPL